MSEHRSDFLSVRDLVVHYHSEGKTVKAVNGVSFDLGKGETIGLVGETGAGKTTIAKALMRILPVHSVEHTEGSVTLEGKELMSLPEHEMQQLRGRALSMIFQDPMTALDPVMVVGDQIKEALEFHNEGKSGKELDDRVSEVLEMVGIPASRKNDYPHQFSGGMKQRVVIAMALVCEPDLLIADEPTTALDVTIQAQVLIMMKELRDKLGTSMIMITHDLGIVAQVCDKVGVMYAGEIIEQGTLEDIFSGDRHHPYTVGLFGAIPNINDDTDRLTPIDGLMPDPTDLPKGCSFSPRCPYCTERCREEKPKVYTENGHAVSCFRFEKEVEQ